MDFDTLPDRSLRRYKELYHLPVKDSMTMNGFLLGSELGRRTFSYKNKDRVTKPELAGLVKRHVFSQPVKEAEIITNFLYKVNNEDKAFKLSFKSP